MAFLPTEPKTNPETTVWRINCMHCGNQVALMDSKELVPFLSFLTEQPQEVLCFKCEAVWSIRKKAQKAITGLLV